ncbi:hypothetical protein KUTeg_011485 [Tegillarca granosa]|uniref:Sodium/potassium-transporting ATPase subunit beta-1-interacting protein n=1 Tax=Tegillarca granosa TaxID=220873 RepID=A0ABQ9F0N2_TEGGR|nr:hypothetical protein KUTeg_011485 [Tegillarca granosa]
MKSTCCQGKCFNAALYTTLLIVIILQLLSVLERQVFDFLGFMWAPIIANFFQIICVIIGGFGTYQYRPKFIAVYSTWTLMYLGWNIFMICLYLEVGILNRNEHLNILNIGTKNKSWWLEHGIGCKITNTSWQISPTETEASRPIPPEDVVEGCLLDYYYVEVIHAAVQCLLAFHCGLHVIPHQNDNLTFDNINIDSFPKFEQPPSYETSMRNNGHVNYSYYGTDRQSVRSLRSVRSKASTKSKNTTRQEERREDLPWVQITPSSSHNDAPFRHYP